MRRAASNAPSVPPSFAGPGLPRGRIALLVAAVLLGHMLVLGWLPVGSPEGHTLDAKTIHLVTRVVPVAPPPPPPPPPPKPRPAPRPPAPAADTAPARTTGQSPSDTDPDAVTGNPVTAAPGSTEAAAPVPAPAPAPAEPPPPAAPAPAPPIGLPAPVVLRYSMTGNSKGLTYHANAELLWQQDGARYTARMEVSAFLIGSRVQTSEGSIGPAGLEPERFGDKARRGEQATHFDRANQRIVFSSNAPEVHLPPGAQDRLGVFLQLASQLAGDPSRYPPGTAIAIPTAGPRDLGDWTFVVDGPETLDLPIGTQATVKLDRTPRKEFDTRVEVWFAPALGYLPVRMRITQQSGDFIDQVLKSAERP